MVDNGKRLDQERGETERCFPKVFKRRMEKVLTFARYEQSVDELCKLKNIKGKLGDKLVYILSIAILRKEEKPLAIVWTAGNHRFLNGRNRIINNRRKALCRRMSNL